MCRTPAPWCNFSGYRSSRTPRRIARFNMSLASNISITPTSYSAGNPCISEVYANGGVWRLWRAGRPNGSISPTGCLLHACRSSGCALS